MEATTSRVRIDQRLWAGICLHRVAHQLPLCYLMLGAPGEIGV
jgi:hypothetical protein